MQVNRLPRETLLCATLYALPIPPPGSSSDANKQRRVPEALGWVTTPLFNFRQYVCPRTAASGRARREGVGGGSGCSRATAPPPPEGWPRGAQLRSPDGPGPGGRDQGTGQVTRTVNVTSSYWAGLVAQDMGT